MSRLLVTGASGLLGLNLALEAAKQHQVYGLVNSHPLATDAFNLLQADLLEPGAVAQLLDETQPDWLIHCAALANLEACERQPELAQRMNAELPGRLAEACNQRGIRLAHISTDAVFDGQRGDYSEADSPNPLSVYARSKLAGEQAVAAADPEAIIARTNMFGWSPSGRRSLAEFFYNNLAAGKPLKGFTDVYFCPLLVNDLAAILLDMLAAGLGGLYHVVSADCLSKYDFGVAIAGLFGFDPDAIAPVSVTTGGLTAARSPRLTLRGDKLARALGRPLPSIADGLARFKQLYDEDYPQQLRALALAGQPDGGA